MTRTTVAVPTDELIAFAVVAATFGAAFGTVATAAGLPTSLTVATSAVVLGGSAQFAAVGVLADGGSWLAAVVAGLALNARFGVMAVAIGGRLPRAIHQRLGMAAIVVDPSVAVVLRSPKADPTRAYVSAGLATLAAWVAGTYVGAVAGGMVASPDLIGLDAALPVILIALLAPQLGRRTTRWSAGLGGLLTLILAVGLGGGWAILAAPVGAVIARRFMARADVE